MVVRRWLSAASVAAVLAFGVPTLMPQPVAAQAGDSAKAKKNIKRAGKATKRAGKNIGEAAKDTGKAIGEETKAGAKATKGALTRRPKGATAQCEDGTYSMAKNRQGACSGHGGVKTWYED